MPELTINASTLEDVQRAVKRLAGRIGVSAASLPTYERSEQSGRPHIESNGTMFFYVVCERGTEFERRETSDPKELLYWVFESVTHQAAFDFELRNRIAGRDSRRIAFQKQRELLSLLDDSWSAELAEHHQAILAKYPFDDAASDRAKRCKELRDSGHSNEEAERISDIEYPLPCASNT